MKHLNGLLVLGVLGFSLTGCSSNSMSDSSPSTAPATPMLSPAVLNTPTMPAPDVTPANNKPFNYNDPLPANEQNYLNKCGETGCI